MIINRLGEGFPNLVPHRLAGKFSRRLLHLAPKFLVGFRPARETDHGHRGRQFPIGRQIIEGGHKLAMGEVAGGPERSQ